MADTWVCGQNRLHNEHLLHQQTNVKLSVLNSFNLLTPRRSKLSHRYFRLALARDLIQNWEGCLNKKPWNSQMTQLHAWHIEHWALEGRWIQCYHVPLSRGHSMNVHNAMCGYSLVSNPSSCTQNYISEEFWTPKWNKLNIQACIYIYIQLYLITFL
jgi:hypothetical protein